MTPRNTNTGGVLEAMILPALERGRYSYRTQVKAGTRCGGGTHNVDALEAFIRLANNGQL